MRVDGLHGDYCERCAFTLGAAQFKRYTIIPMCHACIDQWFQVKDWEIMNKFFRLHDKGRANPTSKIEPGS
jgi:hypothetical protein